jgi:hypothetical protein
MPIHKTLDHTGHSEEAWDKADTVKVAEAEKRFNELVRDRKFTAHQPGANGEPGTQLKRFDPAVEETIFTPPLIGG